jgi:outer membrane protein
MKKILLLLSALAAFAACQQNTIVFVDNTKLVNDYQEKKDIEATVKGKVAAFDKKRDSLSKAIQLEAQDFQAKEPKLSREQAQRQYNALIQKSQFLQQQLQFEEQQIQSESQAKMDTLVKKIKDFVKEYGKKNSYTYILGANEAGSVLYGSETKDITEKLLKALNERYAGKKP